MNTKIISTSSEYGTALFNGGRGRFSGYDYTDYVNKLIEVGFDVKIIKTDNEMFAYINIENVSDIKKIYDAIGIDLIISFPEDEEHMIIEIYDDYRE